MCKSRPLLQLEVRSIPRKDKGIREQSFLARLIESSWEMLTFQKAVTDFSCPSICLSVSSCPGAKEHWDMCAAAQPVPGPCRAGAMPHPGRLKSQNHTAFELGFDIIHRKSSADSQLRKPLLLISKVQEEHNLPLNTSGP